MTARRAGGAAALLLLALALPVVAGDGGAAEVICADGFESGDLRGWAFVGWFPTAEEVCPWHVERIPWCEDPGCWCFPTWWSPGGCWELPMACALARPL